MAESHDTVKIELKAPAGLKIYNGVFIFSKLLILIGRKRRNEGKQLSVWILIV